MTEDERKDAIVAAAERWHDTYCKDSDEDAYEDAKTALVEACQPIEPPYKYLLSDEHVRSVYWGVLGEMPGLRCVGAAILEAMAAQLRVGNYVGMREEVEVIASVIEGVAKKERAL